MIKYICCGKILKIKKKSQNLQNSTSEIQNWDYWQVDSFSSFCTDFDRFGSRGSFNRLRRGEPAVPCIAADTKCPDNARTASCALRSSKSRHPRVPSWLTGQWKKEVRGQIRFSGIARFSGQSDSREGSTSAGSQQRRKPGLDWDDAVLVRQMRCCNWIILSITCQWSTESPLLVNNLNRVAVFVARQWLRNRYPTHRSGRLIPPLFSVNDPTRRALDEEALKK